MNRDPEPAASTPLTAVIWDFDGTLVDTRPRNLSVTRRIAAALLGADPLAIPALASQEAYDAALVKHRTWRDFYRQDLRLNDKQVGRAAALWGEVHLSDVTRCEPFDGMPRVLEQFGHLPQGIVSNNSGVNIRVMLRDLDLDHHFSRVVGYEGLDARTEKPHPQVLIDCIGHLTDHAPGRVLYVGDHETDMECALNANARFREKKIPVEVTAVGALYGPHVDDSTWSASPYYRALTPETILDIAQAITGP